MAAWDLILGQLRALDAVPLVLAVVLGGAIGLERQLRGRPAGLRTHAIVCLAAALLIIVSRDLPPAAEESARVVLDPTRLAAGIVTGIGFLGAATVIRAKDIVRGITTGACVWSVSVLGIVIGYGAYGLAIAATALILVLLSCLNVLERGLNHVVYRCVSVEVGAWAAEALVPKVREVLAAKGVRLLDLHARIAPTEKTSVLTFHVRCRNRIQATEITGAIARLEGVALVEWTSAF